MLGINSSLRFNSAAESPFIREALARPSDGVWHSVAVAALSSVADEETSSETPWPREVEICLQAVAQRRRNDSAHSSCVLLFNLEKSAMLRWSIPKNDGCGVAAGAQRGSSPAWPLKLKKGQHVNPFVPFAMHTLAMVRENSFWLAPIPREAD